MQTIIRVQKNDKADPFARIDKIPLNDPRLSYKAKGILAYVLSKPDGWEVNITDLNNHAADGEKSIRSGILELINNKYCQRRKLIDKNTKRIIKWVLVFYERPYKGPLQQALVIKIDPDTQNGNVDKKPDACFPHVEKPHVENDTLLTNIVNQQKKELTIEDNNNKNGRAPGRSNNTAVVGSLSKKDKKEFKKIIKQVELLGWVGSVDEITQAYIKDKNLVLAWLERTKTLSNVLKNPAGFLRRGIQSKTKPKTEKEIKKERDKLDPYKDFYEN